MVLPEVPQITSLTNLPTSIMYVKNERCPLREIRLVLIVKLLPSADLRQMQTLLVHRRNKP